ncbi:MAG: hypothetical protein H6737_05425 [Alphaproteobacteria bacterium]|nr:hypothetical protein [Alphaproteobacteria bacterium]
MGSPNDEAREQNTVLATYRVKPGAEPALAGILRGHWAKLDALGMVEGEPARIYRSEDANGNVTFVEIFTWKPGAARRAHQHPEIAMVWESISAHVAPHGDRPAMEFPHFAAWDA